MDFFQSRVRIMAHSFYWTSYQPASPYSSSPSKFPMASIVKRCSSSETLFHTSKMCGVTRSLFNYLVLMLQDKRGKEEEGKRRIIGRTK
jgi:hypothetical protein